MSSVADGETRDQTGRKAQGNGFVVDVWITLKRWLSKTVRNPYLVVSSLVQPIIYLVLFTEVFGQVTGGALSQYLGPDINYITYFTPVIVILSALMAAASSGMGLVEDMGNGMFEKVLVSPINRGAMLLGKVLSEVVRIIVQTVIILVMGYVLLWLDTGGSVSTYLGTGLVGGIGIIVVTIVFAIWFTAFSNIVALVTGDFESTMIGVNLLQFPLLFVSSAFLPVKILPKWIQVVATYNPITYGVDAVRALMLGQDVLTVIGVTAFSGIWNTLVPALTILVALDIVLGGIAVHFLSRASSSEVR